ncbi:MAG: LuxR C-terminal-related transcriptional regulator [Gallionellaceae bacterium]
MSADENTNKTANEAIMQATLIASVIAPPPFKERKRVDFFDVIESTLAINTPDQFRNWVKGDLQHIFPHGMLICGIGLIKNQSAHIQQLLTSNFSFSKIQGKLTTHHAELMQKLVPHLYVALIRTFQGVKKVARKHKPVLPDLTEREHDILKWLSKEKTNWEIAQVLCLRQRKLIKV